MRTPVPDYLTEVLEASREPDEGELNDSIPELAQAPRHLLAAALATPDGQVYRAGDCEVEFTIQSVAKTFAYAVALEQRGIEKVLEYVDAEPSGDAYNEVSVEPKSGRPRNPMINIGAITTHGLIGDPDAGAEARFAIMLEGLSAFAGRDLGVDEDVFQSELEVADRNRALAFLASSHGKILADPLEVVRGYIRQCSVLVTAADLAVMGATLANNGINPLSGRRVIGPDVVRQVLSVMTTCGMYDSAGDWVSTVGIPAKSGVSGGILGALPGQVGIGVFSPALDRYGNSVRGVRICERLSADMQIHLMSAAPVGALSVRDVREHGAAVLIELQGVIHFSEAERVLRELATIEASEQQVLVSLSRVAAVNDTGRRMLLEGVRRLTGDGHEVVLIDPDGVLPEPDAGDGVRPTVLEALPGEEP
ncbi:MAG: glutaminase A [Actinomycetia bacterium]|nr:glutaminase A [Actinomycetes bacterium]